MTYFEIGSLILMAIIAASGVAQAVIVYYVNKKISTKEFNGLMENYIEENGLEAITKMLNKVPHSN